MDNGQLRLLSYIAELSALFHDLGKCTDGFQKKLRLVFDNNLRGDPDITLDPVRHELISVFLAAEFLQFAQKSEDSVFDDFRNIRYWFREFAEQSIQIRSGEYFRIRQKLRAGKTASLKGCQAPFEMDRFESDTIGTSILWLILTHHRLPEVSPFRHIEQAESRNPRLRAQQERQQGISLKASVRGYVNIHYLDRVDPFFTIKDSSAQGHPWNDDQWCQRVARTMARIRRDQHEAPDIDFEAPSAWVMGMMYMARPALVFGDHRASMRKEKGDSRAHSRSVFANTTGTVAEPWLADTLNKHLLKTEWDACRYFHLLFGERSNAFRQLPAVNADEISESLKGNDAPEPYDWQNHLGTAASECEGRPTLGIIMAQTGTGKTRGCIKFASELATDGLRCTVGLGLRTLADQTYRDYLEFPVELPPSKVGRMIGNFYPMQVPEERSIGTGASENDGQTALIEDKEGWTTVSGAGIFNGKRRDLILKPVTSMTIDNIIKAVTVKSGIDTHVLMHLMHSDLIVDEIDNFSPADLSFVTVLVHIMGFYGRRVILATATINEVIVEAMRDAYKSGIDKRQAFFETPQPKLALITSVAPYYQVSDLEGNVTEPYRQFIQQNPGALRSDRHWTRLMNIVRPGRALSNVVSDIEERIDLLSEQHCEQIDDLSFSTGFVRMNTVRSAQSIALRLAHRARHPDIHYEYVCYHSKTTGFERYLQEYFLNNMMKRKGQSLPSDVADLKEGLFDRARRAGKSRVVVVVLTTNVIEVGRDHCYDWCVLEPSSLASFVQSIGRVLRHRKTKKVSAPNVALLNAPLKLIRTPGMLWGYPGIETPDLAAGENPRAPGAYRLTTSLDNNLVFRARRARVQSRSSEALRPLRLTTEMIWPALAAPGNIWSLTTPETYEVLPEHSLNLIRLSDYLLLDGQPAGRIQAEPINAGNISGKSGYQLSQVLGQKVRFRHSQNQIDLTCQTLHADYNRPWISDPDGLTVSIGRSPDLNTTRFLLSHIDRESFLDAYIYRFRANRVTRREIMANLFQVTLYEHETDDAFFNCHLGMARFVIFQDN